MVPKVQRQGTRELVVSFENDPNVFTILNGAADNFAVIVSDNSDLNDDNYELRSWFEVKDEEEWGSYRQSSSNIDFVSITPFQSISLNLEPVHGKYPQSVFYRRHGRLC